MSSSTTATSTRKVVTNPLSPQRMNITTKINKWAMFKEKRAKAIVEYIEVRKRQELAKALIAEQTKRILVNRLGELIVMKKREMYMKIKVGAIVKRAVNKFKQLLGKENKRQILKNAITSAFSLTNSTIDQDCKQKLVKFLKASQEKTEMKGKVVNTVKALLDIQKRMRNQAATKWAKVDVLKI